MDASKQLEKLEKELFREWVRRHPILGTALGLHAEYDDKMPDGSLEKELDDQKFLHGMLGDFHKIDPRRLPPLRAVDRDLAIHLIRNWIFDREELRPWESSPEAPRVIGQAIFQVLSRNYAPLIQRMRSIMKRLERMPKYIDQTRSRLRTPVKLFVEIELETITRLPGFFNVLKDIGREHMPPTPQRELNRLIEYVQNSLQRYEDWLIVDILPDCRETFAIGEDLYRRLLHVRGIDLTPAQLLRLSETELERVRERQRESGRAIKRKVSIEDIRDLLKQQHPENFDGVLRYVRESTLKSRQFVSRSKCAPIPEGEQLYVIETPSFLRHLLPFGGYWPPSRFEGKFDGYYFVTPGDCDSDKLKEHNYPTLANMTVREGYPGRHLLYSWAIRHPSPLRAFDTEGALAVGWPAYCEERVKEMGYDDTPQGRFMQGQSSVLNAVRIPIDHQLATGKIGYQQTLEALIDHLGMDRVCAEAEARRSVTTPGAAALPLWGREKLKELRKWVKDRLDDRFTEPFFNGTLLRAGLLPIPLLKREFEVRIAEELQRPLEGPPEARKHEAAHAPAHRPPAGKAAPKPKEAARPKQTSPAEKARHPAKKRPAPPRRPKPKSSKPKPRPKARPRRARPAGRRR